MNDSHSEHQDDSAPIIQRMEKERGSRSRGERHRRGRKNSSEAYLVPAAVAGGIVVLVLLLVWMLLPKAVVEQKEQVLQEDEVEQFDAVIQSNNIAAMIRLAEKLESEIVSSEVPAMILNYNKQLVLSEKIERATDDEELKVVVRVSRIDILRKMVALNLIHGFGDESLELRFNDCVTESLKSQHPDVVSSAHFAKCYLALKRMKKGNRESFDQFKSQMLESVDQLIAYPAELKRLSAIAKLASKGFGGATISDFLNSIGRKLENSSDPEVQEVASYFQALTIAGGIDFEDLSARIHLKTPAALETAVEFLKSVASSPDAGPSAYGWSIGIIEAMSRVEHPGFPDSAFNALKRNAVKIDNPARRQGVEKVLARFESRQNLVGTQIDFQGTNPDGKALDFSGFDGQLVVMAFIDTTPESQEMLNMVLNLEYLQPKGLQFLFVQMDNPNQSPLAGVRSFSVIDDNVAQQIEKVLPGSVVTNAKGIPELMDTLKIDHPPYFILAGRDHKVLRTNLFAERLRSEIEATIYQ